MMTSENNTVVVEEGEVPVEQRPKTVIVPPQNNKKGLTERQKRKIKQNIVGYLYVSPVIIGVLVFTAFPVLYAFIASFFVDGGQRFGDLGTFAWFKNYTDMFTNYTLRSNFLKSLGITFTYALISIPLTLVLGFFLAVLLNSDLKGMKIYRVIYYLPVLIPPICSGLLWCKLTDPDFGVLTIMFESMGLKWRWFDDPNTSMPSFVFINLFGLGGNMILWLAQLKNVPKALYESAQLDGAGKARQLFTITIPMCAPMILYNTIMAIIGVLQTYSQVVMLTTDGRGHGVQDSLFFYVANIYDNRLSNFGYACALSFVLFLIIAVLSFLVMKTNKNIYYSEEG